MQLQRRDDMRAALGLRALQERDVIDLSREVRQQIRYPRAGLTVLLPRALRREQTLYAAIRRGLQVLAERFRQRLARELDEVRLVVEQVERARRSGHVQPDHGFRLRPEVRLFRRERIFDRGPGL